MEHKKENIHAQEVPKSLKPDEDLEKLLKNLEENRPKVSLTPAEIEEDMKFFAEIMKGTNTSSDTRQKKVLSVSEATFKPEPNDIPGVSAKPPKPQHRRSSH